MKRREYIELMAGLGLPFVLFPLPGRNTPSSWFETFSERWKNSKSYTFEVLEAMPADMFRFRPAPDMMAYGKIFTHIGFGIDKYAEVLDGQAYQKEPDTIEKPEISSYLERCFAHFEQAFNSLEETKLSSNDHQY